MMQRLGRIAVSSKQPSMIKLKEQFSVVDPIFGQGAFKRVEQYLNVQLAPNPEMFYVEIPHEEKGEKHNDFEGWHASAWALEEIRRHKGRPAFYEELLGYYEFWKKLPPDWPGHPNWMRLTPALGSFAEYEGKYAVPALAHSGNFLNPAALRIRDYNVSWPAHTRFLAVCL